VFTISDIETTGLNPSVNEIVQFAYLRLDDNLTPLQSGCMYFWHPKMIWGAEEIHHIPEALAREHADEFEDNLRRMYTILSGADVVGHNCNSFDIPFCRQFLARHGLRDMNVNNGYDTMSIYHPVFKKRMKLENLAQELGITEEIITMCCNMWFGENSHAHDARYDVTMTELIFAQALRTGVL